METVFDPKVLVGLAICSVYGWVIISSAKPDKQRVRTIFVITAIIIAAIVSIPIWNRHADSGGQLHGHPFWTGKHEH